MSESMSFADMIKSAQEAGGSTDAPPAGTFQGVVTNATAKRSKSGKVEVGLFLRVTEEGPSKGMGCWSNQYLSPENTTALGIWFRTFEALGIPTAWWGQFADHDQAAAQAAQLVKGKDCTFVVAYEEWKGEMQPKVKAIKKPAGSTGTVPAQLSFPTAAPVPVAPAAPALPASIPAPPAAPF